MNIEKLARHLKEFTLDEIEMIAEYDCKTELKHLLNEGKLVFEQGLYKISNEKQDSNFELFVIQKNKITPIKIEDAVAYFMKEYVKKYCKFETYRNYNSIFNFNILPYLKEKFLNNISIKEIKAVYNACKMKGLKPRRIKNTMALLNQLNKIFSKPRYYRKKVRFSGKKTYR